MRFLRNAWTVAVPLLLILFLTPLLYLTGHRMAAELLSYGGTTVVLMANVVYILGWDPMHRWPKEKTPDRARHLFSFDRR